MGFGASGTVFTDDVTISKTISGALQIKPNLTYPAGNGSALTNLTPPTVDNASQWNGYNPFVFGISTTGTITRGYTFPYVTFSSTNVAENTDLSTTPLNAFVYNTVEFKAKFSSANVANSAAGFGFIKADNSRYVIFRYIQNGVFELQSYTYDGSANEVQTVSGIDGSIEHTYRIERNASFSKFYVDGVLKTTHSTILVSDALPIGSYVRYAEGAATVVSLKTIRILA